MSGLCVYIRYEVHSFNPRSLRTAVIFPYALPLAFARGRWGVGACPSPKFPHPFVEIEIGGRRVVVATGVWWCCMRGWLRGLLAGWVLVFGWWSCLALGPAVAVVAWSAALACV